MYVYTVAGRPRVLWYTSIENDGTRQIRDAETGKIPFRNSLLHSLERLSSLLITFHWPIWTGTSVNHSDTRSYLQRSVQHTNDTVTLVRRRFSVADRFRTILMPWKQRINLSEYPAACVIVIVANLPERTSVSSDLRTVIMFVALWITRQRDSK